MDEPEGFFHIVRGDADGKAGEFRVAEGFAGGVEGRAGLGRIVSEEDKAVGGG